MRVTFAHIHGDHRPGDVVDLPPREARQLIYDGLAAAAPAEPTDTVEVEPDSATGTPPPDGSIPDATTASTTEPAGDTAQGSEPTPAGNKRRGQGTAATEEKSA